MANGNGGGNGQNQPQPRNPRPTLWLILIAAAVFWSGVLSQYVRISAPVVRWLATMVIFVVLLAFAGLEINGRVAGFLIDSRYKYSLSRLQITLWTIVTLSAYLTIAIPRTLPNGLEPITPAATNECVRRLAAAASAQNPPAAANTTIITGTTPSGGPAITSTTTTTETALIPEECLQPEPLNITFPPEVLVALGISAASFAGSTLVQSSKRSKQVDVKSFNAEVDAAQKKVDEATAVVNDKIATHDRLGKAVTDQSKLVDEAKKKLDAAADEAAKAQAKSEWESAQRLLESNNAESAKAFLDVQTAKDALEKTKKDLADAQSRRDTKLSEAEGLLHRNSKPEEARWSDLVRAEEIGTNYKVIDMSKVQMLFFTLVVVFAYGMALYGLLQNDLILRHPLWVDLPAFSSTMNTLLAISHGAYLSVKNVDKTPSAS
jgi:hypothetical protein